MKQGEFEYSVQTGENLLAVARRFRVTLNELLSANPRYRADPDCVRGGDRLIIPTAKLDDSLVRFGDVSAANQTDCCNLPLGDVDWLVPSEGRLTFELAGSEIRGRFFSRKPHVPDATSGVVIGRGYCLRDRSEQEIFNDLREACVDAVDARSLASCRHLTGAKARKFLQDMGYHRIEITPESQYRLFYILFNELIGAVLRIARRLDVVEKYGSVDWHSLDQPVKDLVVDLHYTGDYTNATFERIQPALVSANRNDLLHVISDQYYWVELRNTPFERFDARKRYLIKAAEAQTTTESTP
ncbi:LysM peptidoglycan-binding domain-containing protein [Teredinibacter turnerae]|uniref:LysM peptidoglycan-binding domain-containing protein n=1 Tax=Teredinibacter turnerae TaxID=2426 RepID=UPI00037B6846|nr:LysM peptidoglycan-binding domain-containing protein [Teredinibacter turnerae]